MQRPTGQQPKGKIIMNINDAFNLLNLTESSTQAEIKKSYKAMSLKYHPDRNPVGAQMMLAINAAYDYLKSLGDTVTPQDNFEANDYAEELNEVLQQLFALDGLEIEICGNWIWIGGNTKPHAARLGRKEGGIGCFYASKKKRWYYRPADYKSKGRGSFSIEEIRAKHGSTAPKPTFQQRLSA